MFSKSGIPDIICCYKGIFIGLEVKAIKGKTTKLQEINIQRIIEAGGKASIVRTLKEVEEIIEAI